MVFIEMQFTRRNCGCLKSTNMVLVLISSQRKLSGLSVLNKFKIRISYRTIIILIGRVITNRFINKCVQSNKV